MGLSSSSATSEPWKKAQPYILGGANEIQRTYDANAPKIQTATDSVTGLMPGAMEAYKEGNPALKAATGYNADVLGGKYLDKGNPYLQNMIDQTGGDVRNQVQAAMGPQGLRGGSDYYKMIADRVGRAGLAMRYEDYGNERNLMGQASGQAPGLVAGDNARLDPIMSLLSSYNMPLDAASNYAGSLGGLLGGYQKQTNNPSTASSIGKGLTAAAMLFSDRRLKTDIGRVGTTDGGLPIYTYRYLGEGPYYMGVIAQDVAISQPQALGPMVDGFHTVDYSEVR